MNVLKRQMIMVSSITYAYKARDFLFSKNIRCYIERIPSNLRASGCGYGIRVENNVEAVAEMLKNAGINVKEILTL